MSTPKNDMLVRDVMLSLDRFPVIGTRTLLKEALDGMNRHRLGIACIVGENNQLLGILTDGDIRRMLLKVQKPFSAFFADDALEHAITSPLQVGPADTLLQAVRLMDDKRVWDLPVVDEHGTLAGLLHLHPAVEALLQAGA
jgi:CBS domain-containing protein